MLEEFEGTVLGHRDGHGFVQRDSGAPDIYLAHNEMRAVLHKDRVKVRILRLDSKGRPEGRVVEILERSEACIIGRLLQEGGVCLVAPEDKRYGQDVLIPKGATGMAKVGQVVVVELTEAPSLFGQPVGRIKEVLGEVDDPGMEIEIAVRKYGVPHEFSADCLRLTQTLPDQVRPEDCIGRVDLRDVAFVTIDGEDARDFDDAVYCEPIKTGRKKGYRLLVAIADVSHYVETSSAIDVDAYDRATSVYFPRRVIPMLPEKLSNGLCSLNPHVDRLCMVCDMVITTEGEITAYQFYPAVMHSKARMTYTQVAAILANTRGPQALANGEVVPHLINLHEVYSSLLKSRQKRGAMDFETTETLIVCDDNGRIEKIIPRVRTEAHRLIEETMLAANSCSADFILTNKVPGLFRVHEGPTPEKRELLRNYLKAIGLNMSITDDPKPAEYQAIAKATAERPDAQQIHSMLLRSMQQAIYTPINSGHFGLAYDAYTHFTSPIRRYPDLLVHRVIKAILQKKRYQLPTLPTPGESHARLARRLASNKAKNQAFALRNVSHSSASSKESDSPSPVKFHPDQLAWEAAGLHCSANERRADEASRDVEAWLKCKFMREHLGEEYSGVITAAMGFGIFVTLDSLYVEGMVHITELGGEYFRFDEARQELRGERTGIRYAIGTRVNVQVSRVDLDGRKIDFRLVNDSLDRTVRTIKESMSTRGAKAPNPSLKGSKGRDARRGTKAAPVSGVMTQDSSSSKVSKGGRGKKGASKTSAFAQASGTTQAIKSPRVLSPIDVLKASVKKAVGKKSRKSKR
jgi:ribonuclease R